MARQKTIGILLPYLNMGYDMDVLMGAHAVTRRRGIRLIAIWGTPQDILLSSLAWQQIDGWIAVVNTPKPEGIHGLAQTGVPLVIIGALLPDLACPKVLPDNRGGVHAAVCHLIDHGYQRIAFVGDLRVDDIRERYAGYQAALVERGLPLDPRLVFGSVEYLGRGGPGFGSTLVAQQIIEQRISCSAIVAGNDLSAFHILKALQAANLRVPEDLALVGFDDLVEAQSSVPPLTTVRQSYSALGQRAAELLLAQIDGQAIPPGPSYVLTTLIVRRSCGCASNQAVSVLATDDVSAAPGWQDVLAQQLVRLAIHPLPVDPTIPPAQVWPGVVVLVEGLAATIAGGSPRADADLVRAWQEAIALRVNIETLHAMLKLLEQVGVQRLTATSDRAGTRASLELFLDTARLELARAHQMNQIARDNTREELLQTNYAVSMALLGQEGGSVARLTWMRQTPLSWGCLGLWTEGTAGEPATLVVSGAYRRDGAATVPLGMRYAPAAFPPLDFLPASAQVEGPEIVMLLPVRTAARDWGILAVCGSFESRAAQYSYADVRMWATLLGAALEREALLGSLATEQDMLRVAYEHRLITENIHDLIFVIDQVGHYLYASPSFQPVLGYRPAALLGGSMFDFVHPDDLATVREQWTYTWVPGTTQATFRTRHADGSWRWLEASGTVIVRQGAPSIVVVGRDITERKRLETHILQSQKMESVGRLAGGVAHDFNNLLTAITGYAALALDALSPANPVHSDLEEIQKTAERATSLTRQLLAFARKQTIEPRVLDLNDLILDMDRLLRQLIGEDIELITQPAADLKHVKVDPGQIEQLLVNLAVNARDAMPRGGRLTIETADIFLDATYARTHMDMAAGSWVMLAVSDSGSGMDADVQAHLFEPFFTTKESGSGTGLGLATCYGIVQQHGGHISVYSEVGQGSTFKIFLPAVEDIAAAAPPPKQLKSMLRGTETVLVVEDEAAVRALAVRVLVDHGYTVLEASDGAAAQRVAADHAGTIDLLVTDVVMPQVSGKVLAERLMVLRPGIKVLFMSGYTDSTIFQHDQLGPGMAFLWKPFSTAALARKVRDVLDA